MRWIQKVNEDGTSRFEPRDESARKLDDSTAIHGFHEPYISPVDGSIISDPKSLREHNKRNNVVHTSEFDGSEQKKRQAERERLYKGEHTPAESQARKMEIYETIMKHERAN